jgi:hypothetical protein
VRLLHELAKIHASFDDPNLVSRAGLVPVMALAERAGLPGLAGECVRPGHRCGVNAHLKVPCLVAGMIGGADSIDDMDLLRHGAMPALFGGIREQFTPFLAFPPEVRKVIYTTNLIESMNARLRKVTRNRGQFPSEQAALKVLYLAVRNLEEFRSPTTGIRSSGWKQALQAFTIYFDGRIPTP